MSAKRNDAGVCNCDICKRGAGFPIPRGVIDDVASGAAVIVAGPGIRTEDKLAYPRNFHTGIAAELGLVDENAESAPDVFARYCRLPHGKSRLIFRIMAAFDIARSFSEFYGSSIKFHRNLSNIFSIGTIITTNWDDYLESECAAVPFVTEDDFAHGMFSGRKVFKLHGSINNPGSIVATREEYEDCCDDIENGLKGRVLSRIMQGKTLIYVGYSLDNRDFLALQRALNEARTGPRSDSYIVTLDKDADKRCRPLDMKPVAATARDFVVRVKEHMQAEGRMFPDEQFDGLSEMHAKVLRSHTGVVTGLDLKAYPAGILAASYQDGLLHALERIDLRASTGEYFDIVRVEAALETYKARRARPLADGRYEDVAYIDGYRNGLLFFRGSKKERNKISIFYVYGAKRQPKSEKEFLNILATAEKIDKKSFKRCQELVKMQSLGGGITFHHRPFL